MNPQKIPVLHVMDKFSVGGSTIHGALQILFYLLPTLDPKKYSFKIVGLRSDPIVKPPDAAKDIEILSLHLGKFNIFTVVHLIRIIRRDKPGLLHLHGYASWNFGRLAGFLTGTPVVLQEHMAMDASPLYQRVADRLLSPFNRYSIAVSENVRQFMIRRRSVDSKTIEVIPNGVPLGRFSRIENGSISALREELGVPKTWMLSGAVGRLDPIKGHRHILEAMAMVRKTHPETMLVLIGDGPLMGELKRMASNLGLDDNVRFLGHRNDVPCLLQALDIFIMASLSEGMSIAAGEAMASGKAILASNCEGLRAVFESEKAALFFESQNSECLAEKWSELLGDEELRRKLSQKALRLSSTYDIEASARAYEKIYEKALVSKD